MGLFCWCAWKRAPYPFELDWMEGCMVNHVARLLDHKGIYVRPSLEFVPYIYNVLFYFASSLVARIVGVGFLALRLVSIAATLATFALIFSLVRRETRSVLPSVLAAGLYAGTYPIVYSWLDVGRVDCLALALSLSAIYVARSATKPPALVASALLTALAFATRQNALVLLPALSLFFAIRLGPRRALWFTLTSAVVMLTGVALLNRATDGWYTFYVFQLPFLHPFENGLMPSFWRDELIGVQMCAVILGLYLFLSPSPSSARLDRVFHLLAGGSLVCMSFLARLHVGCFLNDDLPMYVALAVWFGLGLAAVLDDAARIGASATAVAWGFVLCLSVGWVYDPRPWIPTVADRARAERLLGELSAQRGEVLLPQHSSLAARVNKPEFAHDMALQDLLRMERDPRGILPPLRAEIEEALRTKRFGAILLDGVWTFEKEMEHDYHPEPRHRGAQVLSRTWTLPSNLGTTRPVVLFLPN
jgi:hypothetical protein